MRFIQCIPRCPANYGFFPISVILFWACHDLACVQPEVWYTDSEKIINIIHNIIRRQIDDFSGKDHMNTKKTKTMAIRRSTVKARPFGSEEVHFLSYVMSSKMTA